MLFEILNRCQAHVQEPMAKWIVFNALSLPSL